jgi:hypothetical protein
MVFITMCAGMLWSCNIAYKTKGVGIEGGSPKKADMGGSCVIVRPVGGDVECKFREQWREDVVNGSPASESLIDEKVKPDDTKG